MAHGSRPREGPEKNRISVRSSGGPYGSITNYNSKNGKCHKLCTYTLIEFSSADLKFDFTTSETRFVMICKVSEMCKANFLTSMTLLLVRQYSNNPSMFLLDILHPQARNKTFQIQHVPTTSPGKHANSNFPCCPKILERIKEHQVESRFHQK